MKKQSDKWTLCKPWFTSGTGWLGLIILVCIAIPLLLAKHISRPQQLLFIHIGTIESIEKVPTPGGWGSAASPWIVRVSLLSGESVSVESFAFPEIGRKICVAEYSDDRGHHDFKWVANQAGVQSDEKSCLLQH